MTYRSRDLFALDFGVSIWKASRASGSTGSRVSPLSAGARGEFWCLVSGVWCRVWPVGKKRLVSWSNDSNVRPVLKRRHKSTH